MTNGLHFNTRNQQKPENIFESGKLVPDSDISVLEITAAGGKQVQNALT